MKLIITIVICTLAIFSIAGAHMGGFTYETTVNNYFVDIGANKLVIIPGELVLFEYNIFSTSDPNNLADFDNVYVTIGNNVGVQLSTFVHRPYGMLTVLSYEFPNAGQYEMSARFQKGGETMAEVSFPVTVEGNGVNANYLKMGIFALLVGLGIGYAVSKKNKPSSLTE